MRCKIAFLWVILLSSSFYGIAHVLIITFAYNRADVIALQYKTFKKNLLDPFEYLIFNDAEDPQIKLEIEHMCAQLEVDCYAVPQTLHAHNKKFISNKASVRHAQCIEFAMHKRGYAHTDILAIVDGDIFLIKPFSIRNYMQGYDIASFIRTIEGIDFMWPGLTFFDMSRLPEKETISFRLLYENKKPIDIGCTALYLKKHRKQLALKPINVLYGYQLGCPYSIMPQYYSSYAFPIPHTDPRRNNALELLALHAQKTLGKAQLLSLSEKEKVWDSHGFNIIEKNFLRENPDFIDFFLDKYFLHYQAVSNWTDEKATAIARKTMLVTQFIENILNDTAETL